MLDGKELDPPAILMYGISGLLFWSSIVLWIIWLVQRGKRSAQKQLPAKTQLAAWPIGWVNFGILICSLIVFSAFLQLVAATLFGPLLQANAESESPSAWALAIGALVVQSAFLIVFWGFRRYLPAPLSLSLNTQPLHLWTAMRKACPLFIRSLLLIGLVAVLWNGLLEFCVSQGWMAPFKRQEAVLVFTRGEHPIALALLAIFAVILAPLAEEIIFRGGVYRFLKSQMPVGSAMLASACFFALIHFNILALGPLICVGAILAYVYEKERNILVPICFHAAFNLLTLTMTTLSVLSEVELPQ
ncbi:CPBP family intramembrane glutamic endopeptidase [Coraliomargarita akajimensis]|uniref:Abortive infection protein n=1 Tax=Coraliomargarita akajimensis (strain DSM 45221 / IAM 15411 / JCM 23193 / KCTC 12865 / 04OKA010-24) TaxID=583355 RepID=D5EPN7_CORAD|nr:type II CAAX endopeptidase family protein [Coraliomargarita akajimensis]ADE53774.1 Abortive infection protein [Coraliomargarita akajimensis DSM 45221]